jgi:hypothetical protein
MAFTYPLFDRLIDVKLAKDNGQSVDIKCPRTGVKPNITLSGQFAANIIYNAELKLTNLYMPDLLSTGHGSTYTKVTATVGYADYMMTPITGQIWVAYQARPSPDGVTVFQFNTGWYDQWMSTTVSSHETKGTRLTDLLTRVCKSIKVGDKYVWVQSFIDGSFETKTSFDFDGTICDLCLKLGHDYGLTILPDGDGLVVKYSGVGYNSYAPVREITYFKDIKKDASGYTITAPFDPAVRPGTYIKVNTKYMSADLSAMYAKFGSLFYVIHESFEFSTVGDANQMTLLAIANSGG